MLSPPDTLKPKAGDRQRWGQLPAASLSLALTSAAQELQQPLLLVTADTAQAYRLEHELQFFADELPIRLLPDWETLPYDSFSPHQDIISERLLTLSQLPLLRQGILIVPITTLMQRLAPPQYLLSQSLNLSCGDELNLNELRLQLDNCGYQQVNTVFEHGEYAFRGAIIDIFPMGSRLPYRVDLLDREIDTLRSFDPENQRSIEQVDAIRLLPGKEFPLDAEGIAGFRDRWHSQFTVDHRKCPLYQDVCQGIAPPGIEYYLPLFFDNCATLFDYLPADMVIASVAGIEAAADHYWSDLHQRYEQHRVDPQRPLLAPRQVFVPVDELFGRLKQHQRIVLHQDSLPAGAGVSNFAAHSPPALQVDAGTEDPVATLREFCTRQRNVLICAESPGRRESLIELLNRYQLSPREVSGWREFIDGEHSLAITVAALEHGLLLPDKGLAVIAESQLFGRRVLQARRRGKATSSADVAIKNLAELRINAPVVHIDHGVGRYRGLQSIHVDGQTEEFLALEYADGAKLYVPVSSLELISRYSGVDEELAPLHKLGTDQWQRARRKAAEKIRDVAAELLDIYARREARRGIAFGIEETDYTRFAAEFPFEETPDQEAAIEAVQTDMRSARPMDRLVCGDVGFGKTEVAMRAAFIAVQNGHQVVILVPTTLLAQQHFESFRDRFAQWPVNIEVISRFRSAIEQKQVLEATLNGKVDILIGTHKLLNSEIQYRNLGLVIIDEEHRFGVRQKEALKALRSEVDILTLTATPIPRTLNMSISGLRELSIIATPPSRRLSIKTFVRERDDALIKEAILREVLRGGQVYFLHNEIRTIDKTARELQELIPELRIGIGHGQMREKELEQVMSDFYHKRHNLLLCSTIIETGIDVPNANTIIIERADKFGLAQLHQLRGRVGRSHHQAYAYLLTPPQRQMTGDAVKRLTAISEADTLGAGFTLATQDMEIRGAGELLGEEQSGQIQSIGFSLYMEMLDRAVKAMKSGKVLDIEQPEQRTDISLRVPALIPEDYLADVQERLILYKRIASAEDDNALRELQVEMIDRFGLLPQPTKNLFRLTALKLRVEELGIVKMEASAKSGRIEFGDNTSVEPLTLVKLVQSQANVYQLDGATALRFHQPMETAEQRFTTLEALIETLTPATKSS